MRLNRGGAADARSWPILYWLVGVTDVDYRKFEAKGSLAFRKRSDGNWYMTSGLVQDITILTHAYPSLEALEMAFRMGALNLCKKGDEP